MASLWDRDERTRYGMITPRVRHSSSLHEERSVHRPLVRSAHADAPAEGVVIRRLSDDARCKVVEPRYRLPDDRDFAAGTRKRVAPPRS
jgi:hypothetical protein